jgi:hypothetical protein
MKTAFMIDLAKKSNGPTADMNIIDPKNKYLQGNLKGKGAGRMESAIRRNSCVGVLLFLLACPSAVLAIPAITCHCFTDRSYDPARPAMADPYFLATTQNSFFSLVFNVDKKTVVMKKQQGTSAEDLWIAYWVASKTGMSPEKLLQGKNGKETWPEVIAPLRLSGKTLGAGFIKTLNSKSSSLQLANAVVDELFRSYQIVSDKELVALRQAGASNQELIIASVVAVSSRKSARQIYQDVKSGSQTWGALLLHWGIDTRNMQQEVSALLKPHAK